MVDLRGIRGPNFNLTLLVPGKTLVGRGLAEAVEAPTGFRGGGRCAVEECRDKRAAGLGGGFDAYPDVNLLVARAVVRMVPGENWTDSHNDAAVAAYFEMLELELTRRPYVKAHYIRRVMGAAGRSKGSVEFKFENISAVLYEAGLTFIDGYKPAKNYQGALADRVAAHLDHRPIHSPPAPAPRIDPETAQYVASPGGAPPGRTRTFAESVARYLDFAAFEATNRALGQAGERLVLRLERERLRFAGREDLARRVRHASVEDGDGLGYDIGSFQADGSTLFVEVKTTTRSRSAPFYLSAGELEFSRRNPNSYELHRVFAWGTRPRIYRLRPPLDNRVRLDPVSYRCVVGLEEERVLAG